MRPGRGSRAGAWLLDGETLRRCRRRKSIKAVPYDDFRHWLGMIIINKATLRCTLAESAYAQRNTPKIFLASLAVMFGAEAIVMSFGTILLFG